MGEEVYFLGGHDAEMVAILKILLDRGIPLYDKQLSWGAKASSYADEIQAELNRGRRVVLIELTPDLTPSLAHRCTFIDHHNQLAGRDQPTSLEQVLARLGYSRREFEANRQWMLIAANDRGHIRGMRALDPPATDDEIRRIRMADLAAQGVTEDDLEAARRCVASRSYLADGRLAVIRCPHDRAGLAAEMMEPLFGGPGCQNLLVIGRSIVMFYGDGGVIERLAEVSPPPPDSWWGGSLPVSGFWGAKRAALEFDPVTFVAESIASRGPSDTT